MGIRKDIKNSRKWVYLNLFAASKGNTLPLLNALTHGFKYSPEQRELKNGKGHTGVLRRTTVKSRGKSTIRTSD